MGLGPTPLNSSLTRGAKPFKRRRIDSGESMDWIEGIGFAAATLTSIAFVPQALQVWRSRSARDISLPMYLLFATGIALWLTYGLLIGSAPIIFANGFTLTMAVAILVMKVRFDGLRSQSNASASTESLK